MAADHQTVTRVLFVVQVWLWEMLCSFFSVQLLSSLLYKIHFLSQVTIRLRNGALLHRIREDDTSKRWFLLFSVSSWGTHLSSFFTSPICFKCEMTVEWSTLSSSATSHVSFKRISTDDCSQLVTVNFQWSSTKLLIFKVLVSFAKLLEPPLCCRLLAVPGPNVLLILWVFSTALHSELK